MKKFFVILTFFCLFTLIVAPLMAGAEDKPIDQCTLRHDISFDNIDAEEGNLICEGSSCDVDTKKWGIFCMLDTVMTITDWIFGILVVLVGLLVIVGAFYMTTSGGDPSKFGKGRDMILYAAIGLLVALLAKAVPSLVKSLIT